MAKRFTDTDKWVKDKWFGDLEPRNKLFWLYILDNCDNVGVWEENMRVANMLIGYEYSLDTLLEVFGNRLHKFDDGRKFWVRKFVHFQHSDMSEDSKSKAIQSYVLLLKNHGLWKEYAKGIHTLQGKGKGKGKGSGKGTGKGKGTEYTEDFLLFWSECGKGSKQDAFKNWKAEKDLPPVAVLIESYAQYKAHCLGADRTLRDSQGWISGKLWESKWEATTQAQAPRREPSMEEIRAGLEACENGKEEL